MKITSTTSRFFQANALVRSLSIPLAILGAIQSIQTAIRKPQTVGLMLSDTREMFADREFE